MAILRGRLWGQVPLLLTKIKVLVQIRQENVRGGGGFRERYQDFEMGVATRFRNSFRV